MRVTSWEVPVIVYALKTETGKFTNFVIVHVELHVITKEYTDIQEYFANIMVLNGKPYESAMLTAHEEEWIKNSAINHVRNVCVTYTNYTGRF